MAFSWELVTQKRDSTLIGTLLAPPLMVSYDWAVALNRLQKPAVVEFMRTTGTPYDTARTQIAYECLNRGFEYAFYLDSDVLIPEGALMKLLSYRLPIVSGLYHQKFPTWNNSEVKYMPCAFNQVRDDKGGIGRVEVQFQYGQMVEVDFIGAGALLVHRSVFERFLANGIKKFFDWTVDVDQPPENQASEDFDFCAKARKLGYKVIMDSGIQCIHETLSKVDIRGLSAKI